MFEILFNYNIYVYQIIVLFTVFSFMGWLVETLYRSFAAGRVINAGYMYGPFVPIYGFGAVVIILAGLFVRTQPFYIQLIYFAVITTLLELIVGLLVQKVFGHKLWDYTDNKFHYFNGTICLKFSIFWAVLSWLFFYLVFPLTYIGVSRIDPGTVKVVAIISIIYFVIDLTISTLAMIDLFHKIESVYIGFTNLKSGELRQKLIKFKRIFEAFPYLNRFLESEITGELGVKLSSVLKKIGGRRHRRVVYAEKEFFEIVNDILTHSEYLKLKNFYHHNSSVYEHAKGVAYLSYRIAKKMKLDFVSTARGALLHDFFLYDWRNHDYPDLPADKYHGFAHPRIALENSRKYFSLNKKEEDIIVKHMWPLTIIPPRYRESYIVTFADKYMSSKEYTVRMKNSIKIKGDNAIKRVRKVGRKKQI